jgi:multisubunit Na+/H+ antiporter MnhE subunit
VWLLAVWIALFGSFEADVLVGGLVVAGIIAIALRSLAPRWPDALRHPLEAVGFVGHFFSQMAVATWDVIKTVVVRSPGDLRPAVIAVPLEARTRNEITMLMNAISFTPGTVAMELHDGYVSVHVLDTDDPSDVIAEIKTMERRIMAAFGSDAGRRQSVDETGIT